MWSDGVEFTADDLYYTVDIQMKTPGLQLYRACSRAISTKLEQPDKNTVVFHLKAPNSRFHCCLHRALGRLLHHAQAHLRKGNRPAGVQVQSRRSALGAYTLKDFDPNGKWFLWERREDWKKTSVALLGDVDVKYAMYIDPGPKRQARYRPNGTPAGRDPRHHPRRPHHARQE